MRDEDMAGDGDGDSDYLEKNVFPPGGQSPVSPVQYSGKSQSPEACLQVFLCMIYFLRILSPSNVFVETNKEEAPF